MHRQVEKGVVSSQSNSKHFAVRAAIVGSLLFFGGLLLDGWAESSLQSSENPAGLVAAVMPNAD